MLAKIKTKKSHLFHDPTLFAQIQKCQTVKTKKKREWCVWCVMLNWDQLRLLCHCVLTSVRVQINRKCSVLCRGSTRHQTETVPKLLLWCFYMLPLKHSWSLEINASTCRTFRRRQSDVYMEREGESFQQQIRWNTLSLFFFGWTLAIVALSHGFRRKKKSNFTNTDWSGARENKRTLNPLSETQKVLRSSSVQVNVWLVSTINII